MKPLEVIDFHAHAFPDALAERAVPHLEKEANVKAFTDGKISSLLRSMDAAGIGRALVLSIATKPDQFDSILRWSKGIPRERLIAFPSVHPRDPQAAERIGAVAGEGFLGIKLHPYYQDYSLDEEMLFPVYEALQERGLILICHTGFDIAFERIRRCDPARIARVVEKFPRLKFVATHLGAWEDWDEVREHLLGKPIYLETSYSAEILGRERAREMLLAHPAERILFGSDSPWTDQKASLEILRSLELGAERERRLFSANARALLGLAD